MMKIAFVIDDLGDGGAERVLGILTGGLARRGARVYVYGVGAAEGSPVYELDENVSFTHFSRFDKKKRFILPRRIIALRREIKSTAPDVVVGFMSHNAIKASIACLGLGTPVVYRMAAAPQWEAGFPLIRLGMAVFFPFAKGVVYQSRSQQTFFRNRGKRREAVIMNPIDETSHWYEEKTYCGTRVVAVGRLSDVKNFSMLLKAWAVLAPGFPEWTLDIYGEGERRTELECERKALAVEDSVKLPGFTNSIADRLFEASVFVMTSDAEGLPNALLEAMCMGVACVTTDFDGGAAKILVEDGVNGLIVPRANCEALTLAVSRLLEDESLRRKLGKNATGIRQRVRTEAVLEQWEEFLGLVAQKKDMND